MCPEEAKLQALISEWEHLDGLINEIESRYFSVPLVVATLLAAGNYLGGEDYPGTVLAFVVLAVSVAVVAYLAYEFRHVAYLRGVLAVLEVQINDLMGFDAFRWNTHVVPKYMGNSWANYLIPFALGLAFGVIDWFAIAKLWVGLPAHVVIAACVAMALFVVPCVISLFYNGAVTKAVIADAPVDSWRKGGFKYRIER